HQPRARARGRRSARVSGWLCGVRRGERARGARNARRGVTTSTAPPRPRAVLLGVQLPGVDERELASSLDELGRLGKTLGFQVVGRVTQRRSRLEPGAVVGAGKLKELADWTGGTGVVPVGPRQKRWADDDAAEETEETEEETPVDSARSAADRAGLVLVDHELTPSQA